MNKLDKVPAPYWIPFKLVEDNGSLLCEWLYVNKKLFTEPFFTDTIYECLRFPQNSYDLRPLADIGLLPAAAKKLETVGPDAFIFHVSRCGSTLVSQLLSLDDENVVLSEVPFFDDLLRHSGLGNNRDEYLKAAIQFYGQKRSGIEKMLFIKMDSWHLLFYRRIRSLFPKAPFIIMYRDPYEVIRSQRKLRGMQSVPGMIDPALFGFSQQDITYDLDLYMSRVLERYYEVIIDMIGQDQLSIPVNYNEGINPIMKRLMEHLSIVPSRDHLKSMEERSLFHGKYPGQFFQSEQINEAPPQYLDNCFRLYNKLESLRVSIASAV